MSDITSKDISINPDSQLVICHTSIRGVAMTSELVRDERERGRHETERTVTRIVRAEAEYKEAKRLESLCRAAVRTFALHTPLGNISDSKRVVGLRGRFDDIQNQISAHNEKVSHHKILASLLVLPIAASLGPEACRALCEEVVGALQEVQRLFRSGDISGVRSWRLRNKNLDALMPEAIGLALRDALGVIADAQRDFNAQVKKGADPMAVAAALDLTPLDNVSTLILPAERVAA